MPSALAVLRPRPTSEPSACTIPCYQPEQPKGGGQGVQEGLTQVNKQPGKLHASGRRGGTLCGQLGKTAGAFEIPSIGCAACRLVILAQVRRDHDGHVADECAQLWGWAPPVRAISANDQREAT